MDKILIFVLFLGPLVFFHELGHFLFARFFGVRVEVFSIGFGPKLLKWKKKGTEYVVSLIPLGGYVKMFGDDPLAKDELPEGEKKFAFTHKGKWARFWIVFGGPLANFILAFVLYSSLFLTGEKVLEPRLGNVPKNSEFYSYGFRTADVLKKINNTKIESFDDIALTDKHIDVALVSRDGKDLEIKIDMPFQDFLQKIGNYTGPLRAPLVVSKNGEKFYLKSSLEEEGKSLEEILENAQIFAVPVEVLSDELDPLKRFQFNNEKALKLNLKDQSVEALSALDYYPADVVINSIVMGSPADKAGLKKGDILLSLNGVQITSFEELRHNLQNTNSQNEVSLKVLRDSKIMDFILVPDVKENKGQKVVTIGIYSGVEYIGGKMIETTPKGFVEAIILGLDKTYEGVVKTLAGFKMLITAEVSMSNIGGPLAIGKVASDSFYISLSMFFRLMALISINLGIINLFPIPVLDGGHILFIFFEILNKGPLSKKKMQLAQQFGLSLLFLLIFVALFNDISRLFL